MSNNIENDNNNDNDYDYGYIYCLSNPSFQGLFKVGITRNDPKTRARQLYTTGVPTPFKIEFAKRVKLPEKKENSVHDILGDYGYRLNSNREFFQCDKSVILEIFTVIKGIWYSDEKISNNDDVVDEDNESNEIDDDNDEKKKYNRKLQTAFTEGQEIMHLITGYEPRIGIYNEISNTVVHCNIEYSSLNKFTVSHYKEIRPERTSENNAWFECKCKVNNEWVSTYDLPIKNNN
jgi:T5orf172 domain